MSEYYYKLADRLEQPTKRMTRATEAIRDLAKRNTKLEERCAYLHTRIAELEKGIASLQTLAALRLKRIDELHAETTRLRVEQKPKTINPDDENP